MVTFQIEECENEDICDQLKLIDEELQKKIEEESKIPVWEDPQLEDLINLRLEEIRKETGREDEPQEELERIQVKVTSKS